MIEPSKEAVDAVLAIGRWPAEVTRLLEVALPIERERWEQEVRERLLDAMEDARQGSMGPGLGAINHGDLFGSTPAEVEAAAGSGKVIQLVALDDFNAALDSIFEKGEGGG